MKILKNIKCWLNRHDIEVVNCIITRKLYDGANLLQYLDLTNDQLEKLFKPEKAKMEKCKNCDYERVI